MILVLNCGSQSIKWKVYTKKLKLKDKGEIEVFNKKNFVKILKKELSHLKDIDVVGHRVVHGGEKLRKPIKINKRVLKELKKVSSLAPLHNEFNILGIKTALRLFRKADNIAVFDTAFYKDLPKKSYIYPIPGKFRRFGFHGISHEFVLNKGAKLLKNDLKVITCHLGGGSSITAIDKGKVVDTSMGYTPMEGVMMMTRSGDIDPGIVIKLGKRANKILNYESGVKAMCGEDKMLDVLKRKDKKAKLALELFVYKIQKYIGAYYAILNGCDLLIFTGVIGYGSSKIRKMITKDLSILNKTKIIAIKPDEELAIAQKII